MSNDGALSPKYNSAQVKRALLEEVIDLHPQRLTVAELLLRIVTDPDDTREVETASHAIRDLKRAGLIRYRNDDEVVDPTHATFCAHSLFNE